MKSKRAREAAASAVEEPPVKKLKSGDTEAKPTKKKDKKKESRKEKKEKRKDLVNLPEGLDEENGDADGKMDVDVGVDGVDGVNGVNGGEKEKDGKNKKDKKDKKDKKKREKAGKSQLDETTDVTEMKDETNTDKEKTEKKEKKAKKSKKDAEDETEKGDAKDETKEPKEKKDRKEKKNKKEKKEIKDEKQKPEANKETTPDKTNASPPQKQDRHIVFVGNLPYTATQATIKAHFSALNPTSVRCLTKRGGEECRGVAFVEFFDGRAQRACLDRFHHSLFEGRRINVELTAGGGGKTQFRKEKIRDKNKTLEENRARRIQKEMEGKEGVVASGPEQQAMGGIHPSRLARNPRLGD